MRRIPLFLLAAVVAAGCSETEPTEPATDFAAGVVASNASYEVTVRNLTSTQPLTPPLIATHRGQNELFQAGRAASYELKEIAENGNLTPMLDALGADSRVTATAVAVGSVPPLLPGSEVSVVLDAENAQFFSFVSMLICTNDGFTGVSSMKLPRDVGERVEYMSGGYDAGTEINTEDFVDLVPPCPVLTGVSTTDPGSGMSNPALAENGVVSHHAGIQGIADLTQAIHGWTDPVALVIVERVN